MGVSGLESIAGAEVATVTLQNAIALEDFVKTENDVDDREEGEIVDDFEFIISSDEEITMRERIKELEATNDELEQIAIISESYASKYNLATRNITAIPTLERNLIAFNEITNNKEDRRAKYVLTDASSISSVEFVTPKKRKRKKTKVCNKSSQLQEELQPSREHYSRHQNYHRPQRHNPHYQNNNTKQHHDKHNQRYECRKRRQHSSWQTLPNERRRLRNELDLESISLDSCDSSEGDADNSTRQPTDDREEGFMYLNREELRFALARNSCKTNNSVGGGSLKERLQNEARHRTDSAAERIQRQNRSEERVMEEAERKLTAVTTQYNFVEESEETKEVIENENKAGLKVVDQIYQVSESVVNKFVEDGMNAVEEVTASDSSISLEEQELRLIALKSAVLNKHAVRKQRDAEQAYSPTDFEDMFAVNADSNMDVVDVDELNDDDVDEYLTAGMEISPAASPKLLMSPAPPDVEEDDFLVSMEAVIDTKPIDMDIVNSESENDNLHSSDKWIPIEKIPLPVGCGAMMYDAMEYPPLPTTSAGINFDMYMPEIHFEQPRPPPPPPGVTDYEEIPPPPPPFIHAMQSESEEEMQSSSEGDQSDCSVECASGPDQRKTPLSTTNYENAKNTPELKRTEEALSKKNKSLGSASQENSLEDCCALQHYPEEAKNAPDNGYDEDDEEEEALRALLLSKFQSAKTAKITCTNQTKPNISPLLKSKPVVCDVASESESEDPESLRSLLLTNMLAGRPQAPKKPAESILKEAVNRLKMKSHSENSLDNSGTMRNKNRILQKSIGNLATHSNKNVVKEKIELGKIKTPLSDNNVGKRQCDNVGRVVAGEELLDQNDARSITQDEAEENRIIADNILDVSIDKALMSKIQIEDATEQAAGNKYESKRHEAIRILEVNTPEARKDENILANEISSSSKLNLSERQIITNSQDSTKKAKTNVAVNKLNQSFAIKIKQKYTTALKTTKANENPSDPLPKDSLPLEPQTNNVAQAKVPHTSSQIPHRKLSAFTMVAPTPAAVLPVAPHTGQRNGAKSALNTVSNFKLNTLQSDLPLRLTKIIKPNKIINTNPELKRKSLEYATLNKKQKSSNMNSLPVMSHPSVFSNNNVTTSSTTKSGSRLITSADLPTVKKLIITLRKSDTETSEDEAVHGRIMKDVVMSTARFETSEPLICTINNNYYDNASPISLPMESPNTTPVRANSPCADSGDSNAAKSLVNDFFEKKLDNFLRDVRSKVQKSSVAATTTPTTTKIVPNTGQFTTPVSVRHLSETAQQEYRSLVNRMQMLEKQKQAKKGDTCSAFVMKNQNEQKEKPTSSKANHITETKHSSSSSDTQAALEQVVSTASSIKRNLVKEVLIKNANSSKTSVTPREPSSKANVLREYESSFLKLGSGIISNLDKSLQLVEEAKTVKIAKLKHEQRLKELRADMDEVQRKFKHEQQRFSKILPEISVGNEVLTTLKQRHAKLFKSVTNLGKNIKGEDYRLNNEVKHQILFKSKKLASQIKAVNSIKYSEIKKFEQDNEETTCDKDNEQIINSKETRTESVQEENCEPMADTNETRTESVQVENCEPIADTNETRTESVQVENCEPMADTNKLLKLDVPKVSDVSRIVAKLSEDLQIQKKEVDVQVLLITTEMEHQSGQKSTTEINEEVRVQAANEKLQTEEFQSVSEGKPHELVYHPKIKDDIEAKVLSEYISPLEHLRNNGSQLDPNGVICPYELMGQCEDNDCSYMHLTGKKTTAV